MLAPLIPAKGAKFCVASVIKPVVIALFVKIGLGRGEPRAGEVITGISLPKDANLTILLSWPLTVAVKLNLKFLFIAFSS